MLAAASIGAIWSSCSPDFGASAIIDRLGQIEPKILFMCDGYQYQGKNHTLLEKIHDYKQAISAIQQVVICPFLNETPQFEPNEAIFMAEFFPRK